MQIVVVSEKERQWFEPFLPPEFRGSQAQAQLLYGAVDDQTGTAVGAMLVEAADDIVELQWICVADEWRQKGIARQMIDALLEDAEQVQSLHAIHAMLSCREQAAATLLRVPGLSIRISGICVSSGNGAAGGVLAAAGFVQRQHFAAQCGAAAGGTDIQPSSRERGQAARG